MGFFKDMFGKSDIPDVTTMTLDEAINIAGDYGEVLENNKGLISDSKELPHDKIRIKAALTLMLKNMQDRYMQEQIKISYVSLADFQDDIGGNIEFAINGVRVSYPVFNGHS